MPTLAGSEDRQRVKQNPRRPGLTGGSEVDQRQLRMNLLRKAKGIMNRQSSTYLPLTLKNPIIGSLRIGKWGGASLIKYWALLIRLPDVYLICKSDYKVSEGGDKINLLTSIHNTEVPT